MAEEADYDIRVNIKRIADLLEGKSVPEKAKQQIVALENQLVGAHLAFAAQLEKILDEGAYTMMDRARELRSLVAFMRNTAKELGK